MATLYSGSAIAARMAMRATTVIISMRVKPSSPGVVVRPIQCLSGVLRVHVPDVLAAPGRVVGIVLKAALTPLAGSRHGVHRYAAQELELLLDRPYPVDPLDQDLEVGRIALAPHLDVGPPDGPLVHRRAIAVDGVPYFPQGAPELELPLPGVGHTGQGHYGRSQDHHDGGGSHQLPVGHTSGGAIGHGSPGTRPGRKRGVRCSDPPSVPRCA